MNNNKEKAFPASELVKTLEFVIYKDIIEVICDKDKFYTREELRKMINDFLNRRVD